MKHFFSIAILLFSLNSFCQTGNAKEIKMSREKIKGVKTIKDLLNDIPKGCKVLSCTISLTTPGGLKEFTMTGEEFGKNFINIITSPGIKRIIVENIKSQCPKSTSKNYTILIE